MTGVSLLLVRSPSLVIVVARCRRCACSASTSAAWFSGWAAYARCGGPVWRADPLGWTGLIRVDQRVVTLTIPPQEVITRDNVPARVNAVVMFQVVDPVKAMMEVENFAVATSQIAQTTLRSLLGREDLDTVLAHREDLNERSAQHIAAQTTPWGVEVRLVEIKDVEIPEAMQRAMAKEAEAERERRAKIINARGELQASEELRQAAETLIENPASLQLRYLQTLLELGADQNSTVVFPLPLDIITPFLQGRSLRESIGEALNGETTKHRELHPD